MQFKFVFSDLRTSKNHFACVSICLCVCVVNVCLFVHAFYPENPEIKNSSTIVDDLNTFLAIWGYVNFKIFSNYGGQFGYN